jgi:hypothetical protein
MKPDSCGGVRFFGVGVHDSSVVCVVVAAVEFQCSKCGDCGGYFLTSFRIFSRTHTTQRQNYRNSPRSPRTLSGTPFPDSSISYPRNLSPEPRFLIQGKRFGYQEFTKRRTSQAISIQSGKGRGEFVVSMRDFNHKKVTQSKPLARLESEGCRSQWVLESPKGIPIN